MHKFSTNILMYLQCLSKFRTSNCSSSGRLILLFYGIAFRRPYKQSSRRQDVLDTPCHRPHCLYGCIQ